MPYCFMCHDSCEGKDFFLQYIGKGTGEQVIIAGEMCECALYVLRFLFNFIVPGYF